MKILMCHNFYAQEGGENGVFRQEAKILEEHGHTVRLFTRDSKDIHAGGLALKLRTVAASFHSPGVARELAGAVDELRPDVALVQNVFPMLSPAVYTTLHRLGVPVVQLVFNYRLLCANAQLFVDGDVCTRCVHGSTLNAVVHRCVHGSLGVSAWYAAMLGLHRASGTFRRTIARYIVPHAFVGKMLEQGGFPADRIRTLPNPYALPVPATGEDPDPYVLFIGRLIPEKGVITLVRALEKVPGPVRCVIVGDGPAEPEIRAHLAARPELAARVTMMGRVFGERLEPVMRGALAFVLPSLWHDVSPLLMYNALALGKPAIASDRGSQPEIVRDGVDGFVFRAGDADDLATKIAALAADPELRRRMGASGRARAEAEFASEVHYARLRSILEEVTQSAKR